MKECCDVLYHNYIDPASINRILPQIRPDPDPGTLDPAGSGSDPDPPNSPDIWPDPDLDPVHPYTPDILLATEQTAAGTIHQTMQYIM